MLMSILIDQQKQIDKLVRGINGPKWYIIKINIKRNGFYFILFGDSNSKPVKTILDKVEIKKYKIDKLMCYLIVS